MRIDIYLKVSSSEDAINFYVNELQFFKLRHDYGLGNVLLEYAGNDSFCLLLKEEEDFHNTGMNPLFAIGVNDARKIFQELKTTSFNRNAGIVTFENNQESFIEYPLGKNFMLKDPDGNHFLISEWHKNAM